MRLVSVEIVQDLLKQFGVRANQPLSKRQKIFPLEALYKCFNQAEWQVPEICGAEGVGLEPQQ